MTLQTILSYYSSDNPGTKANLYRLLHHGTVGGSGKLMILAVDQGFEHGPLKAFGPHTGPYDPLYHFEFAEEAGFSAFAAPLGVLEMGADPYAGRVPLILKLNSSNGLSAHPSPDQAMTASVRDALRLGCLGVGFTFYPGSENDFQMLEELREVIAEAKAHGLVVVVWSYARGNLSSIGETALDVVSYGAHMACLMGAHIVKVKIPSSHMEKPTPLPEGFNLHQLPDRIRYMMLASFNHRRLVIFSGGVAKQEDEFLEEIRAVKAGGGSGSIIGRNVFQRPREEALKLVHEIGKIYTHV